MPKTGWRQGKQRRAPLAHPSLFYCGVGFLSGDAALAGDGLVAGDAFGTGDDLGDGEGLGETDDFGVGDGIAAAAGFLTGTVAEATSCHCPLRRANVSTDRNWPLVSCVCPAGVLYLPPLTVVRRRT